MAKDKDEYLSKEITADVLGLSVRRLMEISESGKRIKRYKIEDPETHREVVMFRRVDVEELKRVWTPAPIVAGPKLLGAGNAAAAAPVLPPAPPSGDTSLPWLTLDQAATYTGLPAAVLLHLVKGRRLRALDVGVREGGRYRVRRTDLDQIEGELISV